MLPRARAQARAGQISLRPGDRLVIITDGMLERKAAALDLTAKLRSLAAAHPRDTARVLADAVLEVAGPVLADDATLLIIDWHGHHGRARRTNAGADLSAGTSADYR
jgi:serine phosphatase RsbU (regulator of sigma subunit)